MIIINLCHLRPAIYTLSVIIIAIVGMYAVHILCQEARVNAPIMKSDLRDQLACVGGRHAQVHCLNENKRYTI